MLNLNKAKSLCINDDGLERSIFSLTSMQRSRGKTLQLYCLPRTPPPPLLLLLCFTRTYTWKYFSRTWIIKPNNNNMVVKCWVIPIFILWNPFSISSTLLHFTPSSLRMQSAQKDQRDDEMQEKLYKIVKVFKLHKIRNAIASSASSYMVVGVNKCEKWCKWCLCCCNKVAFPSFLFVSHFYTCTSIPLIHALLSPLNCFLVAGSAICISGFCSNSHSLPEFISFSFTCYNFF